MCSPNFAYIEGYHFGTREIPLWFTRLELGLWTGAGVLVTLLIAFALVRYPQTRRIAGIGAVLVAVGGLGFLFIGNPFAPWCGPFEPIHPTNDATMASITANDGVINNVYFHVRPRNDYWSENPVDISNTSMRFVCLTERCAQVLQISDDGTQLAITEYAVGRLYSCQGSDEIAIVIHDPLYSHSANASEYLPENCTVMRPRYQGSTTHPINP